MAGGHASWQRHHLQVLESVKVHEPREPGEPREPHEPIQHPTFHLHIPTGVIIQGNPGITRTPSFPSRGGGTISAPGKGGGSLMLR